MSDSNLQFGDSAADPNCARREPDGPLTQYRATNAISLRRDTPQTMLFDADDTLWENNIYFERAIASFISYLDHRFHSPEEVRENLNTCERATIASSGYGLKSFHQSLIRCFEQLSDSPVTPERHDRIVSFVNSIADEQIELLAGVPETLQVLSGRHQLLLVTKGAVDEQTGKLERSGLAPYFSGVEVLAEKHAEAYREVAARHECNPANTWMIGNSPRSDINPALAAGLHTVFLPHDFTWALEKESIDHPPNGQYLLELSRFAELTAYF